MTSEPTRVSRDVLDPDVAIPLARWDALAKAIDRACDPDQPLIGLAANLEALLCAAADAMPGGES